MKLTILQDSILREKQRFNFNHMKFALRSDYKGNSNLYPSRQHREIEKAVDGLVDLGLCDSAWSGGIIELTLTKKGRDLACLMLS